MEANRPLEFQLVDALLADDQVAAQRLARELHASGFAVATLNEALQAHPELEAPFYAVLQAVIPLSRRAAKRRAIRTAEERDWGAWPEGKRPTE